MHSKPKRYAIGIMSGTSADAIDAVAIKVDQNKQISIVLTNTIAFPTPIQSLIRELNQKGNDEIEKAGRLHSELASLYFQSVEPFIARLGIDNIKVIGCHGQTVRHRPDEDYPFTLQLGNGAALSRLTRCPVVTDFRSADIAAGGQGAPLAPGFHHAVFSSKLENRAIVNIGGIANLTCLPGISENSVLGFDTGPGNTLLDNWIRKNLNLKYDDQGHWANQGSIDSRLLDLLLDDSYFHRSAPKSTGLEYFNLTWLQTKLSAYSSIRNNRLAPADVQATLTALTAKSIANQINHIVPDIQSTYICGGGAQNQTLMKLLGQYIQCRVATTNSLGIDPQWIEGAAFAWMAHRTIHQLPSTLPSVTGASVPTIAGAIYLPP